VVVLLENKLIFLIKGDGKGERNKELKSLQLRKRGPICHSARNSGKRCIALFLINREKSKIGWKLVFQGLNPILFYEAW